jgi:hypothetical protein
MKIPADVLRALHTLLNELLNGPPGREAYMLNGGDRGLLASLDALSAEEASKSGPNGSSIAAHADHLRYGFSLMNRWAAGENPFASADWSTSWQKTTVDEREWEVRRGELRDEATRWLQALTEPREVNDVELAGIIGSVGHSAYHLGAIRQMQPAARGPRDPGSSSSRS